MKKSIITILAFGLFISCSNDSKMMDQFNSNINKRFTEIERKDLKIIKNELSDREAYKEISDYCQKRWEKSGENYLALVGSDVESEYKKINDDDYKEVNKALEALETAKGEKKYYKIEYLKLSGSDTVHYGVSYFDDNQNLIKQIDKK